MTTPRLSADTMIDVYDAYGNKTRARIGDLFDYRYWQESGETNPLSLTSPVLTTPVVAGGSIDLQEAGSIQIPQGTPPVNAVASSLTTEIAVLNANLVFTAKVAGEIGDEISIEYVDPGDVDQEIAVVVTGKAIAISLATNGLGAITSTAVDVTAAIVASEDASALVTVTNSGEDTGEGVVTALEAANLANGADGTVGLANEIRQDDDYIYLCGIEGNTISGMNWKRIDKGSAY